VVTAIAFGGSTDKTADDQGNFVIDGAFGTLTINADGSYTYEVTKADVTGDEVFTYTMSDKDGDKDSATLTIHVGGISSLDSASGLTASTSSAYDVTKSVNHDFDAGATQFADAAHHVSDNGGGHAINGGSAGDKLEGNGGDDSLSGGRGDDLLFGGGNADELEGGSGNDALEGGEGADKMSGGRGDDAFLNIDVADLDGTNTIDGTHSIDGGKGTDTLDLSHLQTFDSSQAARVENVEVLDFTGGGATAVTLNYDAAYGITQVGGLHAFTIKGDASDSVTLEPSNGNSWSQTGADIVGSDGHVYNVFEAGAGASKVTVSIEQNVHVEAS
jgi:VCBS repeat-containing protein